VEDGVPVGILDIKSPDLAKNFCGVDEEQNDDFQCVGEIDVEPPLKERGHLKEKKGEKTEQNIFVISVEELEDEHENHRNTKRECDDFVCTTAGVRSFSVFHGMTSSLKTGYSKGKKSIHWK
jgi:hypothetical protein